MVKTEKCKAPRPMTEWLLDNYCNLWRVSEVEMKRTIAAMTGRARNCTRSQCAMYEAEETMDPSLRRLYYRMLMRPAVDFDASHGNCLDNDAYEWTMIHPSALERAKAYLRTHAIAALMALYDRDGPDAHPALLELHDEFMMGASENGRNYELDFDAEEYLEECFEDLFAPLRPDYRFPKPSQPA